MRRQNVAICANSTGALYNVSLISGYMDGGEVSGSKSGQYRFSVNHMDMSADPMADFYTYSAGNWIARNPVPPDKPYWGTSGELRERNQQDLGDILRECQQIARESDSGPEAMLGRFYSSVMDIGSIEEARFSPIMPYLERLGKVSTIAELREFLALLHKSGVVPLFSTYPDPDKKNSDVYALYMAQGGLGLPNRDYYLEEKYRETNDYYLGHIERVYRIFGTDPAEAHATAVKILDFETDLARNNWSPAELRDEEKKYNPFTIESLDVMYPNLAPSSSSENR